MATRTPTPPSTTRTSRPKPNNKPTMEDEYEQTFKKGTIVEVSSDDSGLRGSWYTATVARTISRKTRKILVEYHNLMADDSGSKPLREFVDAILIRPIPPRDDPARVYRVMEDVDAYHNDGWWEGVVTKVNDDDVFEQGSRTNNCYSVFFRCSREQIDFYAPDLRLHREWVRGNLWVPPLDNHHQFSGQKRKNGDNREDGRNGGHSGGGNDRTTRNGDGRAVGRSGYSPAKQGGSGGVGGSVVVNNGGGREGNRSTPRSVSNGVVARKKQMISVSSTVRSKGGVTRDGTLKEPTRSASKLAGRLMSRK